MLPLQQQCVGHQVAGGRPGGAELPRQVDLRLGRAAFAKRKIGLRLQYPEPRIVRTVLDRVQEFDAGGSRLALA
jgi:hypothetical protein